MVVSGGYSALAKCYIELTIRSMAGSQHHLFRNSAADALRWQNDHVSFSNFHQQEGMNEDHKTSIF